MTWHTSRLAVLDTETTAADPTTARIVIACIGRTGGGHPTNTITLLAKPEVDIPEGATAVHGITTEYAREHGAPAPAVIREIYTDLRNAWADGIPVIIFNAAYDLTVLDREMRRHFGRGITVSGPVIDPFVIDRALDKYRKGKRTLAAMSEHYGVQLGNAHSAEDDAMAAARVAIQLAERFPELAARDLVELYDLQRQWHGERQADFAQYLQRTGKDASDVDGSWPLRPYAEQVAS